MSTDKKPLRVILSGGGTAGHIHPALATAEALGKLGRERGVDVEILFVGAVGKMEMERVPAAGYPIVGLPVVGLQRGGWRGLLSKNNLLLPFKIFKSLRRARQVVREFRPDVAAGFGGYASGPVLRVAQRRGIPTLLQEQNSYAGVTNRLLGKGAQAICVAYEGMERFFPAQKIVSTGNPIREQIAQGLMGLNEQTKQEGYAHFGLDPGRKTILVVGGSLGTRTLNQAVLRWLDAIAQNDKVQVIWQHGRYYARAVQEALASRTAPLPGNVWLGAFVERMDLAYAVADVVVARSGAGTVSELELVGRPVIFVPSPNVAEDHQTKNAMALVDRGAALLVRDAQAVEQVIPRALELLQEPEKCRELVQNLRQMARPGAAARVAELIVEAAEEQETNRYKNVYFVGIGGIGMSALARYFRHEGYRVAGYDRTPSPLTAALEREDGIPVHYADDVAQIPKAFRDPADTLVVYTPAVPADMPQLQWFREQGFRVIKRSRMLGVVGRGKEVMAVAGTHGKTTTTTMVAWFNRMGGAGPSARGPKNRLEGSAFLGGISKNFRSNLVLGSGPRLAVEADEFDRSFLQLSPQEAVITSVDPDHLDIYGTHQAVREAFGQFAGQIQPGGALILQAGVDIEVHRSDIRIYRYGIGQGDFRAENLAVDAGGYYTFDLVCPDRVLHRCRLGIPGVVNVENCVGAVALVWQAGFDNERMKEAIATFAGVERRFDFWVNDLGGRTVYMDDYAHHPEELRAMLGSVRKMFPARHLTVVFQPHLYTRTRDFAPEFSAALGLADEVILLPIYPAREEPIPGVTSELILGGMDDPHKARIVPREQLVDTLAQLPLDVLVTAGAGDIDRLCRPIAEMVRARNVTSSPRAE